MEPVTDEVIMADSSGVDAQAPRPPTRSRAGVLGFVRDGLGEMEEYSPMPACGDPNSGELRCCEGYEGALVAADE